MRASVRVLVLGALGSWVLKGCGGKTVPEEQALATSWPQQEVRERPVQPQEFGGQGGQGGTTAGTGTNPGGAGASAGASGFSGAGSSSAGASGFAGAGAGAAGTTSGGAGGVAPGETGPGKTCNYPEHWGSHPVDVMPCSLEEACIPHYDGGICVLCVDVGEACDRLYGGYRRCCGYSGSMGCKGPTPDAKEGVCCKNALNICDEDWECCSGVCDPIKKTCEYDKKPEP